ncbi:aminodeoxychorismate synthase component 1 [Erwinia mallotivora]|uniref:Aminodeoxychorismate synthase component 1 n=1 Tax=Erwinia mallotivora TaxID=69222 RepID=A0A014Q2C2_9GAMM|nr:aminodeoxychorismate synthase component 1 [Erwinia mallotivora]EXU77277.1 aminodeoxychorismate synthase [Erwinia mallotivora]
MPPVYSSLHYTPDALEQLFSAVSHQPWAMLLHSGFAAHNDNRFDIMVAEPLITLTTVGNLTTVHRIDSVTESGEDPLSLLQNSLQDAQLQADENADYPFQGGALGLFGYDLARRFEKLPQQAERDLFTPDMAVGIYHWALIADHQLKKLTLITHGDPASRLDWLATLKPRHTGKPFRLTSPWVSNMTREQYGEKFRRIQQWLQSGDCYQINLAQRFRASYCGDEWQAFRLLNQQNRAPFSAFIRLPESTLISLSPERFLNITGRLIQTRPIKGTLPRLSDPAEDLAQASKLANSPKDRAENVMIVDLLRNDIGRVASPGSVQVPELFVVEPFPAVHHLVSTITARLRPELTACDLLRACFPGGSITGAPKVRAMEIIDQLEPHRRNAWCGSIGYLSFCGRMDTSITIRTLTAENGHLYCSAGGGIVADSSEQAEYQETFDKINRILPCLGNDDV